MNELDVPMEGYSEKSTGKTETRDKKLRHSQKNQGGKCTTCECETESSETEIIEKAAMLSQKNI